MNIDKGNQARGGESMAILGAVRHSGLEGRECRIKTLDGSGSLVSVEAGDEGRVWLIVGTVSGFEGLSTLYYARISCTLALD